MSNNYSFSTQLRTDGVKSKGFGIIPKRVMMDTSLTLEAKAIYAYLCSFAGNGDTAFPSRSKILSDLHISVGAYYKHYSLLKKMGYLSVQQQGTDGEYFGNNLYTIVSNPGKTKSSNLKSKGFGIVPKSVMMDSRLPIKAKGIYAYFCSLAGSGTKILKKKETILHYIGINKETYQKYYKNLIDLNYLIVDSKYKKDPQNNKEKNDTRKNDTRKNDTRKNDTRNINNINKNYFNINYLSINQRTHKKYNPSKAQKQTTDGSMKHAHFENKIAQELSNSTTLPKNYINNPQKMETAVHMLTGFHSVLLQFKKNQNPSDEETKQFTLKNLFNTAMIQMLTEKQPMKFKSTIVHCTKVYEKLTTHVRWNKETFLGNMKHIQDAAIRNFENAMNFTQIKNYLQYMKACIWDLLQIGNIRKYQSSPHRKNGTFRATSMNTRGDCQPSIERIRKNAEWLDQFLASQGAL